MPAASHSAQRGKGPGVGIEQHLVALARVRDQPERPARAQLHVRDLQFAVDPADHQRLVAPVELKRLAQFEGQWHERFADRNTALLRSPRSDEVSQLGIATFCRRRSA